jgi:1-acyl-sn-glycerol-3-phosphate acyltransferase
MLITFIKAIPVLVAGGIFAAATIVAHPFDRTGRFFHWCAKTWSRFILWIFRIRVQVRGWERLASQKRCIYVANHASWMDIPVVLATIPDQIRIVFKKELTKIPVWGWALKIGHYISIDRARAKDAMGSLDRAAEKIRSGASVLLFAEGTRTKDGNLQPFKRGAFALAAKSGVPIVPLTINNSYTVLPKGSLRVRGGEVSLVLDHPIVTTGISDREGERGLREAVRSVIEKNFTPPREVSQRGSPDMTEKP